MAMRVLLFALFLSQSTYANPNYVEGVIPSDLAAAYMDQALVEFARPPRDAIAAEMAIRPVIVEDSVTLTLTFKDLGNDRRTHQICTRRKADRATRCVIRDYKELGGTLRDRVAYLDLFSGILWRLMPVRADYDWWGNKRYKNLECNSTPYGTGGCRVYLD